MRTGLKSKCEKILDLHLQISWNRSLYLGHWRHFLLMLFQWRSLCKTTKLNLLVSFHEEVCINFNIINYFWLSLSLSLTLWFKKTLYHRNFTGTFIIPTKLYVKSLPYLIGHCFGALVLLLLTKFVPNSTIRRYFFLDEVLKFLC